MKPKRFSQKEYRGHFSIQIAAEMLGISVPELCKKANEKKLVIKQNRNGFWIHESVFDGEKLEKTLGEVLGNEL